MKIFQFWETFQKCPTIYNKDVMKKDKTIQLTYHPTLLNRKPDTKIEKWIIYDNMIQTGITIEDICMRFF